MESINGATVVFPDPGGAEAEAERGPIIFGPDQNDGAYVTWVGAGPKTHPEGGRAHRMELGPRRNARADHPVSWHRGAHHGAG